jgi:multidrug efflux pump subunit AcrB
VVGEQAVTEFQNGSGPVAAAENAALRMLPPVAASSLTTVAAFMPLLALSGATGSILFAIPLVIICVVVASLLECFVVLPGHLRHSLAATAKHPAGRLRRLFDVAFRRVRDRHVRAAVCWAVSNRRMTVAIGFACLIVSVGLLSGGRLGFAFFPQPDNTTMFANARFVAGSPENRVSEFLDQASRILESQLAANPGVHKLTIKRLGEDSRGNTGTHLGHLSVELADNDDRNISNAEIITAWRAAAPRVPGLESFDISSGVHGPPGADIEIQFSGARANTLKSAALEVESILKTFVGVSGVRADTAYGREQLIFGLTPAGQAAGLSEQSLSAQLRSAFEGELVQIFQDEGEEVEVRMMLPDAERDSLGRLETLPIVLPGGQTSALDNIATIGYRKGFDTLRHADGRLAITVTASVDRSATKATAIYAQLADEVMPQIAADFGVNYSFGGDASNQQESFQGLTLALPIALLLIFIILVWVFESYTWPFAVLSVIPFGLIGALVGHWLLDFDLTIMSIFGLFGLTGIVINDSIILVMVFKKLRESGVLPQQAAVDASLSRFRAVILTTITTVFGVMPILFEQAQQAQFLKPMVISLSFGLLIGTFMVLFLLPTLLVVLDSAAARIYGVYSRFPSSMIQAGFRDALRAGRHRKLRNLEPATRMAAPTTGSKEV